MKGKMAAAALLLGAGGALAQGAGGDPLDKAQAALTGCFERNALALDDRTSDAMSIGRAILANCSAERSAVELAARNFTGASTLTPADRARVREGLIDRATAVVLTLRRKPAP